MLSLLWFFHFAFHIDFHFMMIYFANLFFHSNRPNVPMRICIKHFRTFSLVYVHTLLLTSCLPYIVFTLPNDYGCTPFEWKYGGGKSANMTTTRIKSYEYELKWKGGGDKRYGLHAKIDEIKKNDCLCKITWDWNFFVEMGRIENIQWMKRMNACWTLLSIFMSLTTHTYVTHSASYDQL